MNLNELLLAHLVSTAAGSKAEGAVSFFAGEAIEEESEAVCGVAGDGGCAFPLIMDWNYVTLNCGWGCIAGGAPALPPRGMGWGGGDKYLLGLKPPI